MEASPHARLDRSMVARWVHLHCCSFSHWIDTSKGVKKGDFLRPKMVPKTKKKGAPQNPKPKGKLPSTATDMVANKLHPAKGLRGNSQKAQWGRRNE